MWWQYYNANSFRQIWEARLDRLATYLKTLQAGALK